MSGPRYIFTVTPGRSGQATLSDLVSRCCPGVAAAFEEPQIRTALPGVAGDLVRRFRRRFVETHELLGRGRVLRGFAAGDETLLERYGRARFDWIEGYRGAAPVYFDISKYFIRGLHRPLTRLAGRPQLVFLVRDPVANMRSFVNRRKNFFLDNNAPADAANAWPDPEAAGRPEELYFWSWLEVYLRGLLLVEEFGLAPPRIIWNTDLADPAAMTEHFRGLGLDCDGVAAGPALNTNESRGLAQTRVTPADTAAFARWRSRVPDAVWNRLTFMRDYDPRDARAS
ncbi:hypothetical protein [Ferrovibrio sp.]|uniref:hypothetical protein n=1 Tax=Ferrovibrio sp. TaxID=1917215 RepID=UPI0035125C55